MATATNDNGVYIIRALKRTEIDAIKAISARLINVNTHFVILPQNTEIIWFTDPEKQHCYSNINILGM